MQRERLLARLDQIGVSVAARGGGLALIGLGSVGLGTGRIDEFSDLDFFVIVDRGEKRNYLDDLAWLSAAAEVVYAFRNTPDGFKILFEDGIYGEFAVFEPDELSSIPFAEGRVVWKAPGVDDSLRIPTRKPQGRALPDPEWCVGEALTCLYVGMTRYRRGERLSAQSALADSRGSDVAFTPDEAIYDTVSEINAGIYNAALNSAAFEGMATTLVIAWFLGERLWVAHTGDSRLYRYRDDQLEQLTRDHSFSQELLDAGMVTEVEARILPAKNLVTRALGASPEIEPEVQDLDVMPGDVVLLCSDGPTEMVGSYEIAGLLAAQADMHETARRLVDLANRGRRPGQHFGHRHQGQQEGPAAARR